MAKRGKYQQQVLTDIKLHGHHVLDHNGTIRADHAVGYLEDDGLIKKISKSEAKHMFPNLFFDYQCTIYVGA